MVKNFVLLPLMLFFLQISSQTTGIDLVRTNLTTSTFFASQYTAPPPGAPATAVILSSIQANGSFNNAASTIDNLVVNIYKLTYEFENTSSTYYKDTTLKAKLYKALNYWLSNLPAFSWTSSAMDQPNKLGMILVKLYDDFETDKHLPQFTTIITNIRKKSSEFLRYSWSNGASRSTFTKPSLGTTLTDDWQRMGNLGYRLFGYTAIISAINNSEDMDTLSILVANQFSLEINKPNSHVVAALYDGSMHQHGSQIFNIGYGRDFLNSFYRYCIFTNGSKWKVSDTQKAFWGDIIMNGMQWFYYKGRIPHNVVGRHNQISGPLTGSLTSLLTNFISQTNSSIPQYASVLNLKNKLAANTFYQIDSSKYLWNSHLLLHHCPNYFLSIKMLSNRAVGCESSDLGTGQGLMNYHMADGSTMIYRSGKEYDNARAVWNWRAIPGATIKQKTGSLPLVPWSNNYESENTIAGGVSDGKVSIGLFNLNRKHTYHNTTAYKSYFAFNDLLLCLGNSINDSETTPEDIYTTLNQAERITTIYYSINGGAEQTLPLSDSLNKGWNLNSASWFWHDSIGYIILPDPINPTNIILNAQNRYGNWYNIDKRNPNTPVNSNIFQLSINHGHTGAWKDQTYRYAVVPNVTKAKLVAMFYNRIVAQNDSSLYVNYNTSSLVSASYGKYTGIFFIGSGNTQAASLSHDQLTVSSSNPVALLIKRVSTGMDISASDIRNQLLSTNKITLNFNRVFTSASFIPPRSVDKCIISPGGANTQVSFDLSKTSLIYEGEPVIIKALYNPTTSSELLSNNTINPIDYNVYPNPSTGMFKLSLNGEPTEMHTVKIYNTIGALVHEQIIQQKESTFDLSKIPGGIYFLQISTLRKSIRQKIFLCH